MHHAVLIEDLAVVLCIAAIVTIFCQQIKQPTVLGYLIAGLIIGPYTPPFSLVDDEAEIRFLAELGVIFLMFSLGLEFTFNKLKRLGLPAFIAAFFEVVMMLMIGFFAGKLMGWGSYESLLLGAALSISSTTIIIKALEEYNLKRFSFAELMIGILLVEDLLAILLLVYISTTGTSGHVFSNEILFASFKLLLVISSWFLIGYFALPYIMRKIQRNINHETLTITSVALCLFLSSVAVYFNYSTALGAFIMGMILAETPLSQKIEALTLPIRDIFGAVFFVSVGMLINPTSILEYWQYILLLSIITIVGKLLTSGIGALLAGQNIVDSIRIGFSMAQIGEFSFIIIGIGSAMSTNTGSLYPIIVAISAITTFTTPYLMRIGLEISDKAETIIPQTWKTMLKNYHSWIKNLTVRIKKRDIKNIIRFLINFIIIAIIAIVSAQVIIPHFLPLVNQEWPFQFLYWLVTSLLVSPFIWAMLFGHWPFQTESQKVVQIIAWTITLSELFIIGMAFFTFPILIAPIGLLLMAFFKLFFHFIKTSYSWLENNLIYNLTRKQEIDREILQNLAPWEYELVKMKVSSQFPFIGQSLEECRLRPSFGINIVAIKRALGTIWLPNAKERLLPDDELVILGEKEEIDNFREITQKIEGESISPEEPPEVQIQAVLIDPKHILNHHSISDPLVKEQIQGLIVGLERQGKHILNPPHHTVLQTGDVLLYIIKKDYEGHHL